MYGNFVSSSTCGSPIYNYFQIIYRLFGKINCFEFSFILFIIVIIITFQVMCSQ